MNLLVNGFGTPIPSMPSNQTAAFLRKIKLSLLREPMPLRNYFMEAWPIIEPNKPLISTWHIDYLLEYLTAVDLGQILKLLINLPPRHLKSDLVSVCWPTWSWTEKPWLRWIFSSYSAALSTKHSIDRRHIIESAWYQKNWGDMTRLEDDQNQKTEFQNTQRGVMVATSVGGSITGKGGDRIVIDDLINPEDAESKAKREAAIEFYLRTLSTRLDDKMTGAKVVIEQRTHQRDLSSVILKEGGFTHVSIPAEAPKRVVVKFPISGREIIREQGDLICPQREDKKILVAQKNTMGSRAYAAQYQQDPISKEGGLLKYEWWKFYNRAKVESVPEGDRVPESVSAWAWDTAAKTGQLNDFTAGFRIGKVGNHYRVSRIVRQKLEYPDMKRRLEVEYSGARADSLVIEDASSGQAVIQDLRRSSDLPVIAFSSTKDKVTRVNLISPLVEAGLVELPEDDPLTAEFMDQCAAFPDVEHDDMVDAFVIALMQISGKSASGAAGLLVIANAQGED